MRFLVVGCNGMAGHLISLYLHEQGHDVTGFARSESKFVPTIIGDAMDTESVSKAVGYDQYDTIINCIGLLNQYAESNKAGAVYLNSYFPHYLAKLTEGTETQVIHMSTDCVFSGKRGQYTEDDFRDGTTFYDRTKALGELEDDKNLTLRQSIVGPDIKTNGIGLLNWFLQQKNEVSGYTGAIWTGQTTLQLAKTMEAAATQKAHGLINTVPETSITKYELLGLFNVHLRREPISIVPVDKMVADKSLKHTRFELPLAIPDYEDMIVELGEWMRAHKELYPHYDL